MALPEYRKLTESELVWADHCAETGNFSELRKLRELSASRESKSEPAKWHHSNTNRRIDND